jgi:predicted deacylase
MRLIHDAGDGVQLEVVEFNGNRSGRTVALIAGVHGDEEDGVLALRRIAAWLDRKAVRGTVRIVSVANPPAYAAIRRESPLDGLNLARVFPGRPDGSVTERLAHLITHEVIAGSDLLLDLHSASRSNSLMPWCGYFALGKACDALSGTYARAFGVGLIWAHSNFALGRSVSAARHLDVPAIYVEASGRGEVRGVDADLYFDGIVRVLALAGNIEHEQPPHSEVDLICGDIDAPSVAENAGLFVTRIDPGAIVSAGQMLGEIYDETGRLVSTARAAASGLLVSLRREARIAIGDRIATIAPRPVRWRDPNLPCSGSAPLTVTAADP